MDNNFNNQPKKNNKGLITGIIGGVVVIAFIGIVASKLMSGNTISTTTEVIDTDEDIEAQKMVIEEYYDAVNKKDKEALTKILSEDIYSNELEYRANNIVNNYEEDHCNEVEIDKCVKADKSYNGLIYENVKSADDIVNCRVYEVDVYKQYDDGKSEETSFFVLIKKNKLWKVMSVVSIKKRIVTT